MSKVTEWKEKNPVEANAVFKTIPYDHQLEGYNKFKNSPFFALLFDMGTGKSKCAIDIATYKYLRGEIDSVMLIAPNNIHTQWVNEQFPEHCNVPYKYFVYNAQKRTNKFYGAKLDKFMTIKFEGFLKVWVVNVEAFQTKTINPYVGQFVKNNKVMTIVDESSRIKNPQAMRTKMIVKLNKYGVRCILTGTPATKSVFNLWSQYEFLSPNYFKCNYFIFQHRYGVMMRATNMASGKPYVTTIDQKTFGMTKSDIERTLNENFLADGTRVLQPYDYERISAMHSVSESVVKFIETQNEYTTSRNQEKLRALMAPCTLPKTKEECLDLPEKIHTTLPVTMTKEHSDLYKKLKDDLRAEYKDQVLTVSNRLTLTTRLLQLCGGFFPYKDEAQNSKYTPIGKNVKLEALLEDLEEVDFTTTKVIVWATYVAELLMLKKELGKLYNCCLYYGGVDTVERDVIKTDFKAGKYDIFIGNTKTAGFGLNLQNATLAYFYSNSFEVEARLQGEDRMHRIGVKDTCVYKDIILLHTIDERVVHAVKEGRELNDYFKTIDDILSDDE